MIKIIVKGVPVGKGRPRFSKRGSLIKVYTPEKTADFEELVRLSYMEQASGKRFEKDIPLKVDISAFFPIPKSISRKKALLMQSGVIMHTQRPDCDNVAKAVLDALNKLAFHDDSQICDLHIRKAYSDSPETEIIIERINPEEAVKLDTERN